MYIEKEKEKEEWMDQSGGDQESKGKNYKRKKKTHGGDTRTWRTDCEVIFKGGVNTGEEEVQKESEGYTNEWLY